jgi:CheY-like chemotaxis protein
MHPLAECYALHDMGASLPNKTNLMKKQYILLIDDDPDEFEFFLNALEKIPGLFDCSYAISADAAFSLLEELHPDYIFIDMNMPAINGLECTEKLKKMSAVSDIPVFIYSTGYSEMLRERAELAGASCCVKKPSNPQTLVNMLMALHERGTPELTEKGRSSRL